MQRESLCFIEAKIEYGLSETCFHRSLAKCMRAQFFSSVALTGWLAACEFQITIRAPLMQYSCPF